MVFFRKHINLVFLLLLPAVCFLLYNSAVNIHAHQVKGSIVIHAHPFSKEPDSESPSPNHQHSDFEFFILDKIFSFFLFVFGSFSVAMLILLVRENIRISVPILDIRNTFFINQSLRAPPFQI